ncbi:MAG: DUF3048 domain-containing protein [Propionibacteriales bacterium]|nr:DUF3048 domain-containing protein [Propionibacteriales bacterium]
MTKHRLAALAPVVAPLVALGLLLSACSSDQETKATPEPSKGTAGTIVETSPLTGEVLRDGRPKNPVFLVKIENTDAGAPQVGLDQADLVVEELVEGGLTRLAALYYSTLPRTVGHVRSMRATDIGIASPVGGQIVASGGASGTYGLVKKAGLKVFSEDEGAPGFSSDSAKVRPYNRLVDLQRLKRAKPSTIPGPYLDWTPARGTEASPSASASPSAQAKPRRVTRASVRFSGSSTTQWKLSRGHWVRTNGHASREFRADTLVVMFADVGDAGYTDPAGNPVPETRMKGSGRAVVLTADGAVETTWRKKVNRSTLSFTTKDGKPLTIDPGKTWIELVPKGAGAVSLR